MIPEIDNWIINIGAVVAALTVIITAAWKWVLLPIYEASVGDKLDVLGDKLEAYAEDTAAQLQKVNEQFFKNGGSSLRDQTNRIEATLAAHIQGERERARIVSTELHATNQRIETALAVAHRERTALAAKLANYEELT